MVGVLVRLVLLIQKNKVSSAFLNKTLNEGYEIDSVILFVMRCYQFIIFPKPKEDSKELDKDICRESFKRAKRRHVIHAIYLRKKQGLH
jgi:hypothetical protein